METKNKPRMREPTGLDKAFQELNSWYEFEIKVRNAKGKLEELRSQMESVKVFQGGERVSSGGSVFNDKIECYIDKCTELEEQIASGIWQMQSRQHEIILKINQLSGDFVNVLYKRYIERKTFEQIAVELFKDYRWVRRQHVSAMKEYAKLTPQSPIRM